MSGQSFRTIEVTEIAFGEQPAALFDLAPPEGVARIPIEAYNESLCTDDPILRHELVGLGEPDCSAYASPLPTSTPMLSERPSPSDHAGPSVGPSGWNQASLEEDWFAPVRAEPVGGASVQPIPVIIGEGGYPLNRNTDPSGDTGLPVLPWVDIRELWVGVADG